MNQEHELPKINSGIDQQKSTTSAGRPIDSLSQKMRYHLPASRWFLAPTLLIGAGLSVAIYQHQFPWTLSASTLQLEQDAELFNEISQSIPEYENCIRIPVRKPAGMSIGYLHCSQQARAADLASFQITPQFHVPSEFPQKFNFWRKIYTNWDSSQFVVHSSAYPEMIFEIFELDQPKKVHPNDQWKKIKPIFEQNQRQYRTLLMKMHAMRGNIDPNQLTPAMKRIFAGMAHIQDKDKYQRAALTIRAQRGQKDYIKQGYADAARYLPHIKEIFRNEGIPEELAYIAFVESSFNLQAKSKVGASGVFQIMPKTGKQYLTINEIIDERNDPIKAAKAAAKVFKLNYKLTSSWPLSVIAYNHGVGSVQRAIRTVGTTDITTIIKNYEHKTFGFASKNFYFEYIAMLYAILNIDQVFDDLQPAELMSYEEIRLKSPQSISTLMKKHKIDQATLRFYNPDINRQAVRSDAQLPRKYVLKIPAKKERIVATSHH